MIIHKKIRLTFLLVFYFSFLSKTYAVTLANDDFDSFLEKSKSDPNRVYMLKVSATWCNPCKNEASELKNLPSTDNSAVSKAYWNEIEIDKLDPDVYENFLKKIGVADSGLLPFNVAFKNGIPIGSISGFDMNSLKSFVSDAEVYNPATSTEGVTKSIPKLPCGPNKNDDACVFGVSGYESKNKHDTDDFGRSNLKMFADLFKSPKFSKLLAPPVIQESSQKQAPSGQGIFYIKNPFLEMSDSFVDSISAPTDVASLDQTPGKNLRIILTGHGGPNGMAVGYEKKPGKKYTDTVTLDSDMFSNGIQKARQADKNVRAVIVQCYGGQYAEAFMPLDGVKSSSCAAFASLPEKTSEGCYSSNYTGDRTDYLGVATQLKKCDGIQTARDLHYSIVSKSAGHDIPMLSSEYFLLYGAAAKKLSKDKVIDPIKAISRVKLKSGAEVYINRLNGSVVKAIDQGKEIDLPELTMVDCNQNAFGGVMDWNAPDHRHFSLFYLWKRAVGPKVKEVGDCTPVYRLSWKDSKNLPPSEEVSFDFDSGDKSGLIDTEKTIDVSGLKPEAKLMVSRILPYFNGKSEKAKSKKVITDLALEVSSYDPAKANAILSLLEKVEAEDKAAGWKRDITAAMLLNLSTSEPKDSDIALQRLAHLVSSAIAELELRKMAKTDPESATLLDQLQSIKECEKDIL